MRSNLRLGSGLLGLLLFVTPAFAAAPVMQRADAIGVVLGQSVSYHIIALGGATNYTAQGLPAGVAIDSGTGLVSGTPSDVGTYRATINAANADGISSTTLAISVVSPSAAPLIYAPLIFDAFNTPDPGGNTFTCALKATGAPTGYATNDVLPPGWTFGSSGTIVGDTAAPGMHVINANATNPYGVGSAAITINIHPACTQIAETTGTLHAGDRFVVTLTFNRPMSVSGDAPYLELHASDGSTRRLQYVSGSGSATFQFAYTISTADPVGDIALYRTIQPALNGGVSGLTDADGLTLGALLPISGPIPASATIAATASPSPVAVASSSPPATPASTTPIATVSSPQPTSTASTASGSTAATGATAATTAATTAPATGASATPASTAAGRLVNLSARAAVSDDAAHALIAGFVISGSAPKHVLVRAVGPSLTGFGVQNALPNPTLKVFDSQGTTVGQASDASGSGVAAAAKATGAFDLAPGSADAAALLTLNPGAYSMQVLPNGGSGVALAEIYDADTSSDAAPLLNISSRGYVGSGEAVLTAGFVVSGSTPKRVLIRGIGPALSVYGVSGVLGDPAVKVYQNGTVIAGNDNWEAPEAVGTANPPATAADIAAAAQAVGAFPLSSGSRDAALLITLPPGLYSAAVGSANGGTGAGMVEVYQVP